MKVMIHSNAPWVMSGYGQQCRLLAERMCEDHEVAVSAYFGLYGSPLDWNDVVVYPGGASPWGNDVVVDNAKHHFDGQRGVIITLMDVWVLDADALRGQPVASWTPLDHLTLQLPVKKYFERSEALPIAMSKFGQKLFDNADIKSWYVPHGVETDVFTPMDMSECRAQFDFPEDAFIVGMVAANQGNPSRKGFAEAFMAMSKFMKVHTDVILYLHTDTNGRRGQGVNLTQLADSCGIDGDRVRECDQYLYRSGMLSGNYLARMYNCFDVLLNPSLGEGFGIPLVESQACGTPVIATNASAMTEVAHVGWQVDGQEFYTSLDAFQIVPDVGELIAVLYDAYSRAELLREHAREFALRYDANTVFEEYWKPAFTEISEALREKQILELEPLHWSKR